MEGKTLLIIAVLIALAIGYVHYYRPDLETQAKEKYNDLTTGNGLEKPAESTIESKTLGKPDCIMDTDCKTFKECDTGMCYCSGGFCMLKGTQNV